MRISDTERIYSLFKFYANENNVDRLTLEGVICLFDTVGIDVEQDPLVLYCCYKMGCECMYIITRRDIQQLATEYKIYSFRELKQQLPKWREEMKDKHTFLMFYKFLFPYSCRAQPDGIRKRLHADTAVMLWKILFRDQFPCLPSYSQFILSQRPGEIGITNDEWYMSYFFFQEPADSSSTENSWPLLIRNYIHQ